tara:strand:- start:1718 stop:2917 length:1200 start_codon:yes stop_codon:yes gene_type:complete
MHSLRLALLLGGLSSIVSAEDNRFTHLQLSTEYHGEGAAFGELNGDGHLDLVSGPYWYEGPDFKERHEYYPPNPKDPNRNGYTNDNFLVFVGDFNHDQWNDIFVVAFPGTTGHWFANPKGAPGHWAKHLALTGLGNESPALEDLNRDGIPELVCIREGAYGYARIDSHHPQSAWKFIPFSESKNLNAYTHGLGLGDLNGDDRLDCLTKDGWYQQPKEWKEGQPWTFHAYDFRPSRRLPFPGGAQIFAYDIDGDGDQDLMMSLAAHGYGLAWFEQREDQGMSVFHQHTLLRDDGKATPFLEPFSQLHAMALADVNRDGLLDLITGKCRFAHGPAGDPDPQGDPVLYWMELSRSTSSRFIPHLIGRTSGVGRQIAVADLNGDHRPEIAIGNKTGTSVFWNH